MIKMFRFTRRIVFTSSFILRTSQRAANHPISGPIDKRQSTIGNGQCPYSSFSSVLTFPRNILNRKTKYAIAITIPTLHQISPTFMP